MSREDLQLGLVIVFVAVAVGIFIWNICSTIAEQKQNIKWMRDFENRWNSMTKFTEDEACFLDCMVRSRKHEIENGEGHFGNLSSEVRNEGIEIMDSILEKLKEMSN